uniref:Uncharacterized protein n=1 Tax=Tanacetum cinerariifolium TaxID=118510 RepID=A0A6L2J4M3_TANCI|nr:hypothetical protein [Tanacetum cinerariifolium]
MWMDEPRLCLSSSPIPSTSSSSSTGPSTHPSYSLGLSGSAPSLGKAECSNCQPKKKKARKDVFTVNFHFDGIFTSWPLKYAQGQVGYESGNEIDMYVEHFGYDIMELVKLEVNKEHKHNSIEESDDEYYGSDDYEEIENVDFQTEGDESLVIKSISTHDPFLTKLCGARIMFRGTAEHLQTEEPLADPDDHQIHVVNKVQSGVLYPAFDPDIPWDKMEPTLGMRYETPYQLKLALANYGVAHGYQLWYMENDWREVLVYYGRNVEEGRCAGKKGNKDRVVKNKVRSGVQIGVKKKVVKKKVLKKKVVKKKPVSYSGKGTSQSPKWTKKQIKDSKHVVCPFRMYASWMSNEHSFQIKSLNSKHKCCRNYNLGSLVTLSLVQCRRAKQLALFDHGGGLIEHYGRLYQYRQALLDSNLGSTCRLDVEESSNSLNDENEIAIISDSHKGLIDAVNDWLLKAEHKKYTRHIYANFKKKYSGLLYQRLFWAAASCTLEQQFMAFFEIDKSCAAFENGIFESFNRAILELRHKPIITMLEEIRLYIMPRLVAMNKIVTNLQDTVTPSIRKRLEVLKEKQSGFQKLEVRKDDQSYGVNLQHKKKTNDVPPLPPLVRRMPGRPQKSRIKDLGETSGSHTNRMGRTMTYINCWQKGHNKASCKADPSPKPPIEKKTPGRNKQSTVGYCASRGRGIGRGGSENEASVSGMGGIDEASGNRAVGSTQGGMAGSSSMGLLTSKEEYQLQPDEEAFRECMKEQAKEQAKYDVEQEMLDKEMREEIEWEEKNDYFNPANFREDSLKETHFNHTNAKVFMPSIHSQPTQQSGVWVKDISDVTTEDVDKFPGMKTSETTNVAEELFAPVVDKGKRVASVAKKDSAPKKKRGRPPSHIDGVRIYHENRGRSERIAKIKEKKAFEFDKHGTGSTPDKAFDVSE